MKSTTTIIAQRPRGSDLDSRYGEIGIPAVAAAVQYKSETKAPAEATTRTQLDERWLKEIAA
jgi:hypothetical protein